MVNCPALQAESPTGSQRIKLLMQIGKRFEPIVWGCIGVLFFTGIVNIFFAVDLTSPTALSNAFMRTLLIKNSLC